LWGCLPLALLSVALYVPPQRLPPTVATAWASLVILGWFLAYTVVSVPYRALGPELSDDYDERTALFSIREGLLVVGTVVAAVGPGVIGLVLGLEDGQDERRRFAIYAAVAAPMLVITCITCGATVRERFAGQAGPPTSVADVAMQLRQAFANRPFVILLSAFVVIALGSSLPAVLISYFASYWLGAGHLLPVFLLIYFGVGMACLPGWVWLSRRRGKKATWLAAMAVNAGFFAFVSLVGPGQVLAYGCLVACSGIGGVAVLAMPYAMQADVIDHDELLTGERREGLYGGLWSIAEKTAAGVGLGLAMLALDVAGYVPNREQTPLVLDVLRSIYVGVPCTCMAAGFVIALRYPLDRAAHRAIAAELPRAGTGP
jgi:GPH family glycoside/pentoside/hexuronide:cation symporter